MGRLRTLMAIVIALGSSYQAPAMIPMVLRSTIQLPAGGPWDVQHVTVSSSYGWARLVGDTILFRLPSDDSVGNLTIQPWVYRRGESATHSHMVICLFRMARVDSHICAMVVTSAVVDEYSAYSNSNNIFSVFDLESGEFVDTVTTPGSHRINDNWGNGVNTVPMQPIPWPPLPAVTTNMVYVELQNEWSYYPGEMMETDAYSNTGLMRVFSIGDGLSFSTYYDWDNAQPFMGSTALSLALSGGLHERGASDVSHHSWSSDRCWISTLDQTELAPLDSSQGCQKVVAQVDEDGTRRIICPIGAFDPETYRVLWTRPQIYDTLFTGRLAGDHNERLLALRPQSFDVYNAATGELMDFTSVFSGQMKQVHKQSNAPSEIVTFDAATNLVRIYVTALPRAKELTLTYIPETDRLRLRWVASPDVAGYAIYSSETPDGEYTPLAEVPAGTTTYELAPTSASRYFYVTNGYDNP
jgi:hypothetical protein